MLDDVSEPAVRCRGITKAYGTGENRVPALQGIDLDVERGELMMLVGPSGSGKTTLISVIASILDPDSGDCTVFGEKPAEMNAEQRARFRCRTIGFVFQIFNLLPALTALENVAIPLLIGGTPRREAESRARDSLELMGLGRRMGSRPGQLSGGQQQRVALARALVHDPRLIVCDEPTSNLDHAAGQEILGMLRDRARKAGRAILVVTHDQRIYSYADKIARMDDGRIVEILAGAEKERLK